MTKKLFSIATALFLAVTILFTAVATAQDSKWSDIPKDNLAAKRAELAKILQETTDESTLIDAMKLPGEEEHALYLKMLACKRLGTHGTAACVPTLAAVLNHRMEGYYARYALETIPVPEAGEALCKSASSITGPEELAGVLTSMAVRVEYGLPGMDQVAEVAQKFLNHNEADVRRAAAYAFAATCSDEAQAFFTKSDLDALFADAAFHLAEQLAKKGAKDKAIAIYDALPKTNAKPYQKESAIYHNILARGIDGINLFKEQLQSESPKQFAVALKTARELPPGAEVAQAMVEHLATDISPARKALLIRALGDRTDKESKAVALPALKALTNSDNPTIRLAIIEAYRKIGDPTVLPMLIEAANDQNSTIISNAARNTLANLPGKEIDQAIVKLLETGNAAQKIAAIGLIEERRILSAFPLLNKELKSEDAAIRKASLDAIGQNATIDELPILLDLLKEIDSEEEADAVLNVLKSACTRMPQDAASAEVAKRFEGQSVQVNILHLDLLKEIGGPKAMEVTEAYAWGNEPGLKDKATAILGQWRSPQDIDLIAAACLKLAKESKENKFKIRGLRGYIRLARQFTMSEERRIQICDEVFQMADRNDDKALVFDVYWRNPSLKTLQAAMKHVDNPAFKDKVCNAAVVIGEKIQGKDPAIAAAMKKVIEISGNEALNQRAKIVLDRQ